jgi:uncharacterized OB-fold protein
VSGHPRPDPAGADDVRFWSFVAAGELRIQRCTECGAYRHPPRPICAACGSAGVDWVPASGRGEVWASTVVHPPTLPAFASRAPYNAVVVRLEEGVFMVGNILDGAPEDLAVGIPVEMTIVAVEPDLHLPQFRSRARSSRSPHFT